MQVDRIFLDGVSTARTTLYTVESIVRFYYYMAAYILFAAFLSHAFEVQFDYKSSLNALDTRSPLLKKMVEILFHPIEKLFLTFKHAWGKLFITLNR